MVLKAIKQRSLVNYYADQFRPFFIKMCKVMAENHALKGDTWKTECSWSYLMDKMLAQVEDMQNDPDREDYYANIANYAAMLWNLEKSADVPSKEET